MTYDAGRPCCAEWERLTATIRQQAAELERMRGEVEGARSTLSSWFDVSKKTEEELHTVFMDALKGYLRVSRSGGMPLDKSDLVESVVERFSKLYLGPTLLPVLRGIAANQAGKLK